MYVLIETSAERRCHEVYWKIIIKYPLQKECTMNRFQFPNVTSILLPLHYLTSFSYFVVSNVSYTNADSVLEWWFLYQKGCFFLRMISCYPISRSKCLGWVKRLRDDDRDNLLTSVWTKIVDRNHHYQSVPDIQIFTIAILFTVESWYTISWHRNYRRVPTQIFTSADLDIVKEWHSLSTADIDALTDGPGRPLTNDHDIMVILFLYRISLINIIEVSYCNRSWLRVCRKNMFIDSQIQVGISR